MPQRPTCSVIIAAMFALVFASSASANIPAPERPTPPNPRPAPEPAPPVSDKAADLSLTIKLHDNGKPMKLELPAKQAGAVKGAAGAEAGDAATGAGGASETRMIVAAVMLSLGAMTGGLWLARKRSRGAAMALATVVAIAAAGLWVSDAFGNRAPPRLNETPTKPAGLTLRVESNAKGEAAVLYISEEQLKAITEQLAAQKKAAVEANAPRTPNAPPAAPR